MGEFTGIEWTHHTFNPWIGCEKVSPACDHCYAEAGSKRIAGRTGLKLWEGDRFFTGAAYWQQLAKWDRAAREAGERRRVFCASFADWAEDRRDLDPKRAVLGDRIYATPHLDYLMLTKRIDCAQRLGDAMFPKGWPPNVWLGTTVEDQQRADERIPHLLATRGPAVRFVSYEPALGPVDFRKWMLRYSTGRPMCGYCCNKDTPQDGPCDHYYRPDCPRCHGTGAAPAVLDWIIVGGESGPHARPFHARWARATIAACKAAGVACFHKQMGLRPVFTDDDRDLNVVEGYAMRLEASGEEQHIPTQAEMEAGVVIPLHDKKGGDWDEWPEDLRVREFPGGSR